MDMKYYVLDRIEGETLFIGAYLQAKFVKTGTKYGSARIVMNVRRGSTRKALSHTACGAAGDRGCLRAAPLDNAIIRAGGGSVNPAQTPCAP